MMNLLIIREKICAFWQKYDRFFLPLLRFVYTLLVIYTWSQVFGYNTSLYRFPLVLGISFVCAFVPSGVVFILSGVFACVDLLSLHYSVAILMAVLYVIVYLLYLRLVPQKSWLILATVILLLKLPCFVPLLVAVIVGPLGILPTLCGIVLYYFGVHSHELQPLLVSSADNSQIEPLNYLVMSITQDKEMLLFMIVFSVVIMVTYLIYRSSVKYSWFIAMIAGTVVMILALLGGSIVLEDSLSLGTILFGSIASLGLAVVVQFFKCMVDYSRIENVQFEDDDYYYYVKAIPKISVAEKNINVQKINARRKL